MGFSSDLLVNVAEIREKGSPYNVAPRVPRHVQPYNGLSRNEKGLLETDKKSHLVTLTKYPVKIRIALE